MNKTGVLLSILAIAATFVTGFKDEIFNNNEKLVHSDQTRFHDQNKQSLKSVVQQYLIKDNESVYVEFAKTNISVTFGGVGEMEYATIGIHPDGERSIKKALFSVGSIRFSRGNNKYVLHILGLSEYEKSISFSISNANPEITT